ncbi:solute carrier family 43 member 3-like [Dendronephthya gigantea]|uniref:solute carrier family 43 member 3-like n=1 Tax=Dendronephthya gigantea TaxID=151771 RepID=UPI00106CFCB3|nr:solute carrier family 43 member 3-like [Dendronephthya gigantea]
MQVYYICLVTWAVFESVISTSCLFGWAQLLEILHSEHYFASYCETNEADSNKTISQLKNSNSSIGDDVSDTCARQDSLLILAYTLSAFAGSVSIFFGGKFLDVFGFTKTRVLTCFIYLLAGGTMFMSTYDLHELLFPGLLLTVIGGGFFTVVLVKVCGVLPQRRFMAVSIINGAIDSSAVVLLVFKLCFNAGVSFKIIIIVYYVFVVGQGMLFTFTIFPKDLPDDIEEHVRKCENNSSTNENLEQFTSENPFISREIEENEKEQMQDKTSLSSIVKSTKFVMHTCFVSIAHLRCFSVIGMINSLLKRLAHDFYEVDYYLTILGIIQFCGIILSFVPGFLLDWAPAGRHRNFSVILSFILTGLISILLTVGLLIPVLEFQVFNFFLYALLRCFLYSTHGSFVMKEFPLYHAGALFGLSLLVSAVVSLFQIPMFALMEGPYGGDPTWVNAGLLVVQMVVMVHPIYLWKCAGTISNHYPDQVDLKTVNP